MAGNAPKLKPEGHNRNLAPPLQELHNSPPIQAKLEIGEPGDKYEQEADKMADQVMMAPYDRSKMVMMAPYPDNPTLRMMPLLKKNMVMMAGNPDNPTLRMKPQVQKNEQMGYEEEEKIQPEMEGEEEMVQTKSVIQKSEDDTSHASSELTASINSTKGQGIPLPKSTNQEMGSKMGADFSNVKIHTDNQSIQMNNELGAKAFTHGSDIYFNKGNYNPDSSSGKHLLAHELTHTVQQNYSVKRKPLDVALSGPAPKNAITIQQFISLVELEEKKFPKDERNTKLMITRLRKIFYGKDGWDEYLISAAKSVKRPYKTSEKEVKRYTIEIDWAPDLDVVDKQYSVTDPSTGKAPKIAKSQEIRLADGTFIDIGHVFAGLDALNFPQMVDGPLSVNIDKNVDAVTWVGDLGSVLAEVQFKGLHEKKTSLTNKEKQGVIDEYAPAKDMLGNIDAYVIGDTFDINKAAKGQKVSEILREFYLGAKGTKATKARLHRYSIFAGKIGLKTWDGSKFKNESAWIEKYADQVNDAAALYVGANSRGFSKYGAAIGMSMNDGSKKLVKLFIKSLKKKIIAEPKK